MSDEKTRLKAYHLSVAADEAASVVENFGTAVINGDRLIDARDVAQFADKLRYYGNWLRRIAQGEPVTEEEMQIIEERVKSVRIPKKNAYKRDIIEVVYVMDNPDDPSKATRIKLAEIPQPEQLYRGDTVKIPAIKTGKKYGHRLPTKA